MTKIQAWHFTGAALRDGRPIPADGEVLHHDGPLVMCASGLHWSRTPLAALGNAPGATLCRVEVWGDVVEDGDKGIARNRVILWRMDATDLLREFARRCALDVAHLWNAPEIVLDYLCTGDETKRRAADAYAYAAADAAAVAAYAAADAADAAAYAAADAAAYAADAAADAADAAYAAARAAAYAYADAAYAAAVAAARAAQNARLTDMIDRARERVLSGERAPSASGSIAP